jgi:hypothetical protein
MRANAYFIWYDLWCCTIVEGRDQQRNLNGNLIADVYKFIKIRFRICYSKPAPGTSAKKRLRE